MHGVEIPSMGVALALDEVVVLRDFPLRAVCLAEVGCPMRQPLFTFGLTCVCTFPADVLSLNVGRTNNMYIFIDIHLKDTTKIKKKSM